MDDGMDSMWLNPDTVVDTWLLLAKCRAAQAHVETAER
jgi:hypothetical protein